MNDPFYNARVVGKDVPLPHAERASLNFRLLQKSCAGCGLNQLCLPASIGGDDLPLLDQIVEVKRSFDREQTLYAAGQHFRALYVVRSGAFKTFVVDHEGECQVLGFHLPGEIMGLDAIASGHHECSAEAFERVSLREISSPQMGEGQR